MTPAGFGGAGRALVFALHAVMSCEAHALALEYRKGSREPTEGLRREVVPKMKRILGLRED